MSAGWDAKPMMSAAAPSTAVPQPQRAMTGRVERPKFVDATVEERLGCALCGEVLMDPVQTPCAKRVCRDCIFSKFAGTSERLSACPLRHDDEDSLDDLECKQGFGKQDINSDPATRRQLYKESVYCYNKQYGCPEQMEWRKLEDHVQVCKFMPKSCDNAGCDVKVAEALFSGHKEECGFAKIKCDYCGIDFLRNTKHPENCLDAPAECDICEVKLKSRFLTEQHKRLVHFTGPAPCYYSAYGCKHQLNSAEEFASHHSTFVQSHLELLTMELAEIEQRSKGPNSKNGTVSVRGTAENMEDKFKKKHRQLEMFLGVINTSVEEVKMKLEQGGISVQRGNDSSLNMSIEPVKRRIETLERRLPSSSDSETLSQQAREISQLKLRIIELDGRLRSLSAGITPGAGFSGILTWKITDYARKKQDAAAGRNVSLYSQPFYSGETGYKMCGRIYLNGDGLGKGKCLSLFFVVMKGDFDELLEWPFVWKVTFSILCPGNALLDYSETFMPDKDSSSFRKPITDMNIASGCPEFKLQSEVESKYLKNDMLYVRIKVHDPVLRD